MIKCLICNREFNNMKGLSLHINQKHNITSKEYYDKYLKKENEGICSIYGQIPSCKRNTVFISITKGYRKHCSVKCSESNLKTRRKKKSTFLKKYGVENPAQNKKVKEKFKQTCLKKYGVGCPLQNERIKDKIKQINLERYGVENPSQNKEVRNKFKQTCLNKYGYESPAQNKEIYNKIKQTNLDRYGYENSSQNKETREKFKKTCLKKFGFKHPSQNKEIREKIKQKNLKKFIPLLNKQLKYLNLELLDEKYLGCKFNHKWKCLKCNNNKFQQTWNEIQQGYNCPKCHPRNQGYSKGEKELVEFIKSLELNIIENDRNIIKPYELDIHVSSKKIAIEFDGLYWHSEKIGKTRNYHLSKTESCQSNNIQLIHIFEDEWIFKQDIVKSRLKQILNISTSQRIHARKCKIKEISPKLKNKFLNKFHIQGEDRSNIKLGAFYNDELISVMTFSKGNISKGSKSKEFIWELNRFCSNSSYHIPGIASRFLAYFKRNYEWKKIFSYADRRWSEGNVYYKIGFKLDSITKPNYWYIKGLNRIHRFNLRKKSNEPKDIPEWVLRTKEGYHRIWDCGHYKFVIKNGE